jgi:hypothetical protein
MSVETRRLLLSGCASLLGIAPSIFWACWRFFGVPGFYPTLRYFVISNLAHAVILFILLAHHGLRAHGALVLLARRTVPLRPTKSTETFIGCHPTVDRLQPVTNFVVNLQSQWVSAAVLLVALVLTNSQEDGQRSGVFY